MSEEIEQARLRVVCPLVPSTSPLQPGVEARLLVESCGGKRLAARALDAQRLSLVFQVDSDRLFDVAALLRSKGFDRIELEAAP